MGAIGYYGYLAARVPPHRLLATAARRAVRGARNRLAPPLAPSPRALLEALGCDGPAGLAALLARPRPARPAWSPEALRRALEQRMPGEVERALARAEAAAAGRLVVYGREVDVRRADGGTDWQRDPIHGGRFDGRAPSAALPPAPGLDPKMAWAMGRGEHWVALACGAALHPRAAGGDRLAEALAASVTDFAAQNPVGRGVHWTCAMEAGLRAWHLATALWVLALRRAPAPSLAAEAARLLVASGRFVLANLEDGGAVPNNHLVCDWLGLLACAEALPEWPEAPRWRALAAGGLARTLAEQVHAEGTSFEGSVPYHRFSLELFAAGLLLARAGGAPPQKPWRLHAMFRATRALAAASGDLPQLGDNDSGHALALRARGPTEAGYLCALGAALFRDPALLRPGAPPDDALEAAWLLGPEALDWLARARPGPPPGSVSFPAAGVHVLRRGALEAFVSCGPHGQRGVGGHDHNDKLSFELRAAGALAVCDPGMPVYGRAPEVRDAFRSTRAHATVTVDGLEQSPIPPGRLFALPDAAGARLLAFAPGGEAERLAGEHRGFVARAGVVHRRELALADGGLVVIDRLAGRGTHAVELRWPLAHPAPQVRQATAAEAAALARLARLARLRRPADPARVIEVPLGPAGHLLVAFAAPAGLAPELAPSLRSPGYGELVPASVATLAGPLACPAALATLFLHVEAEGSHPR
ncbi:Heparinase II/III family protein [Anaeromyxobacter sp. K]|uniref:heparinase II/III family protein n=1 Tax=Anaeromyxobacter sp. (strain K) TaxID=447217 RepID=UPI00015F8DCA|nr:alginate lyase family protein [Anaeromyxobacter sp. K]ACG72616.1 Heparinase II/III family protein [Anaeromyxobacter sp. K]